ncbi:MAG TPA: hypothetical protein ENI63_01890 [Candidatus Kaiserbacteria bacterium]|nr:hypothetical protein [Candidatus Kaiserbacteria bacterium]
MTKLKTIRKACIKANESILDLKFGCEVLYKHNLYRLINQGESSRGKKWYTFLDVKTDLIIGDDIKLDEIIGCPITLSDVLLAINHSKKNWDYEEYGTTIELQAHEDFIEFATNQKGWGNWDLKENLDWHAKNSPKTIDLIYNLIK